jgi:hypothetical protein
MSVAVEKRVDERGSQHTLLSNAIYRDPLLRRQSAWRVVGMSSAPDGWRGNQDRSNAVYKRLPRPNRSGGFDAADRAPGSARR